jgi:predicted acetyltransferase
MCILLGEKTMTPQLEFSILRSPEEIKRLGVILNQSYVGFPPDGEDYINQVGAENFRIIHQGQQMIGGLAIITMGQWWGGVSVPMSGIAAVAIAPEYRGDGAALMMMHYALKELHEKAVPISVLFPATQRLYRKAGYEQAGIACIWEVPCDKIQVREQPLPLELVDNNNLEAFYDLYKQQAKVTNGYLDRNQFIWQRLIQSSEKLIISAYLIGGAKQPQGYIILSQDVKEGSSFLRVRDWVVINSNAAKSFWSFIANHRSQIEKVGWKGSAIDSLTLLLPEQPAKVKNIDRWMLRVIDAVKALEMRGYAEEVQAELHLEIHDDLLAANNGKFILSVTNGRGEVTKGGMGELKLDIKGLAPLYTGLFTPHQLQIAGQLEATETALLAATQIFAGTSPWIQDFF